MASLTKCNPVRLYVSSFCLDLICLVLYTPTASFHIFPSYSISSHVSMKGSALFGQPPNSTRDYQIIRGLLISYGFPESTDPAHGFPTKQHAPPNYSFETRGPGVIAGLVVAALLSFLITGTRLLLRGWRKDLRWGLDDWVIIPAGVGRWAQVLVFHAFLLLMR